MRKRATGKHSMTRDAAEAIGLQALLAITAEATSLGRFLAETGLDPAELRARAGEPELLAAVLGHLLSDDSALLVFTSGNGLDPLDVHAAHTALAGASPWDSV
jgi:uroporphyrinogen-III synthase